MYYLLQNYSFILFYSISDSSTLRGRRHRQRKRTTNILEDFENEALSAQKSMSAQIGSLAENFAKIVPTITAQQTQNTEIKDILFMMNKNLETLINKIDRTNILLEAALNV